MTDVLEIIKDIIRDKKGRQVVPEHALRREVLGCFCGSLSELDNSISELKTNNRILQCHTINDVAFSLVENNL